MFKKNGSMSGTQPSSTFIINISMISWSLGVQLSTFSIRIELVVLFPPNSISPNDSIIKASQQKKVVFTNRAHVLV